MRNLAKKVLGILCLVTILFSMVGCKGTEEPTVSGEKETNGTSTEVSTEASTEVSNDKENLKFGVIYLLEEAPYYQAHSKHTKDYADELGIELVELDGKCDQALMTTQMENLIAQGVDGIIYCLLEGHSASMDINDAQAAGIPVVTYAIPHDQESADAPFIGMDEFNAGKLGGIEAAKLFQKKFEGEQAKIAVIERSDLESSTIRSDGFLAGFQEIIKDSEVVVRLNGEGIKDAAMAVTEDMIQIHPEVNVFYGANGDQGLGALAALEAQGRGTIETELVISHDGSEPEVLKIADEKSALKIAIANQPKNAARATIDTLLEIINGERDMKNTDNIMVSTAVFSGDDLDYVQNFIKEQYCSNTIIK